MASYDIGVIGGDGIGPEVTREALKVLDAVAELDHARITAGPVTEALCEIVADLRSDRPAADPPARETSRVKISV